MRHITILGCGLSGTTFAKKVRELDADIKITLIDKNPYFINRWEFFDTFDFKRQLDLAKFAAEINAEFICDTLERVNVKRQKIYFKDKECRDYETLVVAAGIKPKKIAVKGEHREGFFYFAGFDAVSMRDRIQILSDAVIYLSTILGVKLCLNLRRQKKDVNIIAGNLDFLGEKKEQFLNYCARENVGVYHNVTMEEAIGEATVRAVKLNPLKVLSAQALFLDTGFATNNDFFESEGDHAIANPAEAANVHIIGSCSNNAISDDHFFANEAINSTRQALWLAEKLFTGGEQVDFMPEKEYNPHLIIEELFLKYNVLPVNTNTAPVNQE